MPRQFILPDLGEGLEEAEIVAWLVNEGDHVVANQPLVSVETDKAVVEIPSPWSGTIARRFGAKGLQVLPAIRALARKLDVNLNLVQGSGTGGMVTRADVERAARSLTEAGPAEPLKGMRRAMAQRMALAHAQVVPTTVIDEADINAWSKETDITIRLVQAMAAACKAEPSLNAWYNAEAGERRLLNRIDVGIAVDLEGGLLVPVLRNVGERESADLRAGLNRMRADAAARSIPPEELRGATITLSNFGMIGGRFASLVVVPPQVAIIGAGRAERRVVVNNDQQVIHRMLPLSLTFDHRAVTGGEAARFLAALKSSLQEP
jgi:pyruvate dehydrogenase E2 component (dihydrolipoamide acetyltransferase)